ncbi:hypothetical protein BBK14_27155 [Parafrankia soli]|uniref:Uncharacterized protein n=1 Tax=Parafrankia soli TaxID=2599596 RepID=A0A1S1PK66_9ACTN|nr:hypothetical protein [Parafrankia soli]OHV21052.1 hypothetical protein BBK14_27155 [Parafrankia soli]
MQTLAAVIVALVLISLPILAVAAVLAVVYRRAAPIRAANAIPAARPAGGDVVASRAASGVGRAATGARPVERRGGRPKRPRRPLLSRRRRRTSTANRAGTGSRTGTANRTDRAGSRTSSSSR